MLKRLPLDIQTFRKLRELNCVYIDKTEYAYKLITEGQCYFLSRPRRFGKSLFVSTLYEILSGNKELFGDLWIGNSDYQWKPHAVISLSLSIVDASSIASLRVGLCRELNFIAKKYDVLLETEKDDAQSMFVELIRTLHDKYGRVVILIDEYDNPILKNLHDKVAAIAMREFLRTFFAVIKDLDDFITFVFLTGVTSFSRAGIFSGLNNLQTITLDDTYNSICGYTDREIDFHFKEYIALWAEKEKTSYDELRKTIKEWYNGYRFGNDVTSVYNPFSFMNAIYKKEFKNFWFQTGTPTFLVEELKKQYEENEVVKSLDAILIRGDIIGAFDVSNTLPLNTLLFQTGYLTVKDYDKKYDMYTLTIPNEEVRVSISGYLMGIVIHREREYVDSAIFTIRNALENNDITLFCFELTNLLAGIPYHILVDNEAYFHSLVHLMISLLGYEIQSEVATSQGRIDLTLILKKTIYLFEFKFNSTGQEALNQIRERRYYEKYLSVHKDIILVGISFNHSKKKLVLDWVFEKLKKIISE